MTANKYRKQILLWISLLITQSFLFPFILMSVVPLICSGGPEGCGGAVATVIGMTLKPVLVSIPLAGLVITVFKRCFTLSFGLPWTAAAVFGTAASHSFFLTFGNFWGANFGMGYIVQMFPPTILMAFALTGFLAVDWPKNAWENNSSTNVPWYIAAFTVTHATFLNLPMIVLEIPVVGSLLFVPVATVYSAIGPLYGSLSLWMPQVLSNCDLAIFVGALAYIYWKSNSDFDNPPTDISNLPEASISNAPFPNISQKNFGKR